MGLMPLEQALAQSVGQAKPLDPVEQPITEAANSVLAGNVTAQRTQPPWDTTAMDGYAVRAADITQVPATLQVIGTAQAGHRFSGTVGQGEAVRIFTGAPMPTGADTIVIQENVAEIVDQGAVQVHQTEQQGRYVRPAGLDFRKDNTLLETGAVLFPQRISLLASAGLSTVKIYPRPRVAILSTGDELVPPGSPCGPDQIISSNNIGVAALARNAGADVIDLGIAADDPHIIKNALEPVIDGSADILVTSGGASVGDHDHIRPVLTEMGVDLAFWKIAMRPGKPLMYGRKDDLHILGLPGNPVSAMVCSKLFLEPLIRALQGDHSQQPTIHAKLTNALPANDHRQDYMRAILDKSASKAARVTVFGKQDSSMLATLARSNALAIRPPHAPAAEIGDVVEVIAL